jgi:hypothetical protein
MNELDFERFEIKNGNEPITFNGKYLGHELIEFWRWSSSDLLSNATRGKFAEFIVAIAMDAVLYFVREEWAEYDISTGIELEDNKHDIVNIEVKSSSYLQTWEQNGFSKIIFSIKKKGVTSVKTKKEELKRPSDVYVFCLLKHKDKETVDPLNMDQWLFYVLSTKKIDEIFKDKSSITLESLEKITKGVQYDELKLKIINEFKDNKCRQNGT